MQTESLKLAAALLALVGSLTDAAALGTDFSYQGQLNAGGVPANGNYDLSFALFNTSTDGSQLGSTFTNAATPVSNGLFSVTLDFGSGVFTGTNLWLQLGVRTNGATGGFTVLSPRQPMLAVPYALYALTAAGANIAPGAVGTLQLAAGAVQETNIAPQAVGSGQLAVGAVQETNIAPQAVGSGQLAVGAVQATNIAPQAVGSGQLAVGAVQETNIAPRAVGSEQLAVGAVQAANLAPGALTNANLIPNMQVFTANGTFTAPQGVTKVMVELWGAGGGGGAGFVGENITDNRIIFPGAGGGGGAYAKAVFNVNPGTNYAITVGIGGSGGSTNGGAGGTSSFGSKLSASGGAGGQDGAFGFNSLTNPDISWGVSLGGAGGAITSGPVGAFATITGGDGQDSTMGSWAFLGSGGNGGAAGCGGAGGKGPAYLAPSINGSAGVAPGGGGSGGNGNSTQIGAGGAGASGRVIVYY